MAQLRNPTHFGIKSHVPSRQSRGVNISNTPRHLKYFYGLIQKTKVSEMSVGNRVVDLYA